MLPLEKELNTQQLQAVQATEGPLLVLAGAGSGKTRVITYRIAHLVENKKVGPEHILAVTFTNKAAEQMKDRVSSLLHSARSANPLISTFHSFCLRILRREISAIGYRRDFTIYDETDQLSLVKSCLKETGIEEKLLSPRTVLSRISYAKNHGSKPEDLYQKAYDSNGEKVAVVFDLYEKRLKRDNALDFDDLLLKTVDVLDQNPSALRRLCEQFRYVMVDEYQDTNRTQYQLIRLLTHDRQNICVVGDEDQSIYSWRGADIQNILSFEHDYPEVRVIKLEQNYRSTSIILDAAGAVISNNQARKGKTLWTEKVGGEPVTLFEAPDAEAEAVFVAHEILKYHRLHRGSPVTVLYRTNFQSRQFEEACRRQGVKYSIVGGFSFYERAEIKDLLAYLKLALNPHDSVSLIRIINTPTRGIGKTTLETLEQEAHKRGLSMWQTLQYALEQRTLTPRTTKALANFRDLMQTFMDKVHELPVSVIVSKVLEESGYTEWLRAEGTEEANTRIENLQELLNAARDSEDRGESLQEFLDHAALVSDTDDYDEQANVNLMTLHSAKGLEFPLVFLVGLEEGLFPHSRASQEAHEIEEERRLCYVGMTRAREKLILTRAKMRRFLGGESFVQTVPSRFISEIPLELMNCPLAEPVRKKGLPYAGPTYNTPESIREFYQQRGKQIDLAPRRKETPEPVRRFKYGSHVRHPKFGVGMVIRCEGEGDDSKLTISFPGHGLKKMVLKYAGLEKV